jgi:hypothetical protein
MPIDLLVRRGGSPPYEVIRERAATAVVVRIAHIDD